MIKRLYAALLFVCCSTVIVGQSKTDSLVNLAISLSEEALFNARFDEAKSIVDSSYFHGIAALTAEQKIVLIIQEFRIDGYRNIVYAEQTNNARVFERLKNLLSEASQLNDQEIQATFFLAYSNALRSVGKTDSVSYYLEKAISSYTELGNLEQLAMIRANNISRRHMSLFREKKKQDILALIPEYLQEINFSKLHSKFAHSYNTRHLAQIHRRQTGNLDRAMELFQQSLSLRISIGFKPFLPASYASIGDVYFRMEKYHRAIQAYSESVALADSIGFVRYQSYSRMRIGDCFLSMNNKTAAREHYVEALKSASMNNHTSGIDQIIEKVSNLID